MVKATCVDEACTLRATGTTKVKVLKPNGKVKKTKKLKLKKQTRTAAAGKQVKLKLKLNNKAGRSSSGCSQEDLESKDHRGSDRRRRQQVHGEAQSEDPQVTAAG